MKSGLMFSWICKFNQWKRLQHSTY